MPKPRPVTVLRVRPLPGRPSRGILVGAGLTLPCALGRTGISRFKREGDGATPAGRFPLVGGFFRADRAPPAATTLALVPTPADLGWCDDAGDGRYNRPVRLPFPGSHETLRRDDPLYDVVIVLDHNLRRRSIGRGSAVFFHLARPDFAPTAGCVAVRPADMRRLLPRLRGRAVMVIG